MDGPWEAYQTSEPSKPAKGPWVAYQRVPVAPASSPYVPTSFIDTDLKGQGLRATGDYRSPTRERELAAQGAGTVAPGRTSNHSRGTPDAPGAHDFVPTSGDWNAALAAARKAPGVKDAFVENAQGGQGRHIHVDMAAGNTPWLDYQSGQAPPTAKRSGAPWLAYRRPTTPAFAVGGADRGVGQADPAKLRALARGPKKPDLLDAAGRYAREEFESGVAAPVRKIGQDFAQDYADAQHPVVGQAGRKIKRELGEAGDVANAAMSLGGGELMHAGVVRPLATAASAIPGTSEAKNEKIISTAFMGIGPEGEEALAARRPGAISTDAGLGRPRIPKPEQGPRQPELAETAQGEHVEGSAEAAEPVVGDEREPATRTANALYRLRGHATADKIEASQFLRDLPRKVKDPKTQEALYHAIEQKMVDPNATIPKALQPAAKAFAPYYKEQTDIINRLRERADPDVEKFIEDQGYVHRIRKDTPHLLQDDSDLGRRDPFRGNRSLVKKTGSQMQRKFFALEDEKGKRTFVKDPDPNWEAGMQVRGSFDRPYTVKQATTKEIEANTPTKYIKNALTNTVDNVVRLRRVERNLQVLDSTLKDMKARGVAHQAEWSYRDEDGKLQSAHANQPKPDGFHSIHDIPQLKGWVFDHNDPQVQELKDFLPKHEENWVSILDKVNNFMLRSNFLSPFVHPKNIAEFWATSRGGDWLDPGGYGRLAKTMPRAVQEVLTMGPAYRRMLREGSGLLYGDSAMDKFHETLVDKGAKELADDPKSVAEIAKSFGVKINPAKLYDTVQRASHKMMWAASDMMMLQRQLELESKGMTSREAIRKAEEVIPNYRVPAQVANSRMLAQVFKSNRLFAIGRYHYNKLAAWGRMFKKVAKGAPEERQEALGQFLVMTILGGAVLPAIDKAVQMATGNKNARVKRGGILSIPDAVGRTAQGKENISSAIASLIDLSPGASMIPQAINNKDRMGRDIVSPYASPAMNTASGAEFATGEFGPANMAQEAASPGYGAQHMLGNLAGLDLPKTAPGAVKGTTAKYLRGQAKSREKKDPLAQQLEKLRL